MSREGRTGGDAELLFEKWAVYTYGEQRVARSGVKSKFQRQDFFGTFDFIVLLDDGTWGVQVTTRGKGTGSMSDRRRKIEKLWTPMGWRRSLVTHESVPDPAQRARLEHYWRVQDHRYAGFWSDPMAIKFDLTAVEEAWIAPKRAKEEAELAELRARVAAQHKAVENGDRIDEALKLKERNL